VIGAFPVEDCVASPIVDEPALEFDTELRPPTPNPFNPTTRIATLTPDSGPPIFVQFAFNVGGPCNTCLGSGRRGPTFAETVTEGSRWTLTYTTSLPAGAATWFPGGTVNSVYRAVAAPAK
jgi:hypothetical protein